jgi:hypothetical protein
MQIVKQKLKRLPNFIAAEDALPCIQQPAIGSYHEPTEYTSNDYDNDDDDIYLLQLVFHPVVGVG